MSAVAEKPAQVTRLNPVHVLFFLAIAVPMLAFWPQGQDEAKVDWAKEVDRAATSTRYGLRLAAARKVAAAGPESVPAIRAFAAKHGRNALPPALVEAMADQTHLEAVVWELLIEWAKDSDFYWRAQAMRGLALRAPKLAGIHEELRGVIAPFRDDPAWLMRTHARLGLALMGDDAAATLPEDDPRATTRLTALLLANGKLPSLQPLIDALADERTFLGVPWAKANAQFARDALKAWLGEAFPPLDGDDKPKSIAAVTAAASAKSGQQLVVPKIQSDGNPPPTDGFEMLSCKHGDVFVQWTKDGLVRSGIDGRQSVQLSATAWEALTKDRTALDLGSDLGVIVCDALRLCWTEPKVHVKVAPRSLPATTTNWLKQLAQAIEEAGNPRLAETLRTGLEQFAVR